jgi:hypothetical protein
MGFHPRFQVMMMRLVVGNDHGQAWKVLRTELTESLEGHGAIIESRAGDHDGQS